MNALFKIFMLGSQVFFTDNIFENWNGTFKAICCLLAFIIT